MKKIRPGYWDLRISTRTRHQKYFTQDGLIWISIDDECDTLIAHCAVLSPGCLGPQIKFVIIEKSLLTVLNLLITTKTNPIEFFTEDKNNSKYLRLPG